MKKRTYRLMMCVVALILAAMTIIPTTVTVLASEIDPDKTDLPQPDEWVAGDFAYVSDLYWMHSQAYNDGAVIRDGNCANEYMFDYKWNYYPKGIGMHAASGAYDAYVDVNIEGIGYTKFATYYGICDTISGNDISMATVKFAVFGDGDILFESDVKHYGEEFSYVEVDVTGVSTLRLAVAGVPSISGAWGTWGGAVLSKSGNLDGVTFTEEFVPEEYVPETEPNTEPTTKPNTEPAETEPVTEPVTTTPKSTTAAAAPTDTTAAPDNAGTAAVTETQAASGGCGSLLAGSTLLVMAIGAVALARKREE